MFFYFFIFLLSLIFFQIGIKNKSETRFILLLFSVLIPSIIASLRDETLGRDMSLYVIPFWDLATSYNNFIEYKEALSGTEFFYILFNYIISRFTDNIHIFMFFHQGVLMTLIILTAYKVRNLIPSAFVLIFYFLYMYNTTYSMARQSLAIMIYLYGCTFLLQKNICFFIFI